MTYTHCVSTLMASMLRHIDPSTRCGHIYPDFLTITYAAHSPRFPWCVISNVQNFYHVQQIWTETYAAGFMNVYSMMADICPCMRYMLTTHLLTCMMSLTYNWLLNFGSNSSYTFSPNCNRQCNIQFDRHLLNWFGVNHISMACMTLPHAMMNYQASKFGH